MSVKCVEEENNKTFIIAFLVDTAELFRKNKDINVLKI